MIVPLAPRQVVCGKIFRLLLSTCRPFRFVGNALKPICSNSTLKQYTPYPVLVATAYGNLNLSLLLLLLLSSSSSLCWFKIPTVFEVCCNTAVSRTSAYAGSPLPLLWLWSVLSIRPRFVRTFFMGDPYETFATLNKSSYGTAHNN